MNANDVIGLLVLDKPTGMTSRVALDRALRWFPRRTRAGHAGTLDPLATGVLVIALGPATRLVDYVQAMAKTYLAEITLGATSDTDDVNGTLTPTSDAPMPSLEQIQAALTGFVGTIEQTPPAYSAAKVAGRRAYDLARRGDTPELAARSVTIHGIDMLSFESPRLSIEVRCSKGTYIRSLARDLGQRLGCGGYISALRRTRIGRFTVEDAVTLESDPAVARAAVRPLADAVSALPHLRLSAEEAERLRHGQPVTVSPISLAAAQRRDGVQLGSDEVALFVGPELLAVATVGEGRRLRSLKMLPAGHPTTEA